MNNFEFLGVGILNTVQLIAQSAKDYSVSYLKEVT